MLKFVCTRIVQSSDMQNDKYLHENKISEQQAQKLQFFDTQK